MTIWNNPNENFCPKFQISKASLLNKGMIFIVYQKLLISNTFAEINQSTIIEYANGRMERLQDKLETTDRDLGKFKQKSSFKLSHIGNIQNTVKESFQKKNSILPKS